MYTSKEHGNQDRETHADRQTDRQTKTVLGLVIKI